MSSKHLRAAQDQTNLLYDCLGLHTFIGPLPFHDVVFISIDFENPDKIHLPTSKHALSGGQMGVAVLDTRDLESWDEKGNIISTYNFAWGRCIYIVHARRNFIFGATREIKSSDIASTLEALVPRSRNVVLVAHGSCNELAVLERINFDTETSIVGVLDTFELSKSVLPSLQGRSLEKILQALGIPYHGLHCAGNDANFTLRVLLHLGVRGYSVYNHIHQQGTTERLRRLSAVGLSNIPTDPNPPYLAPGEEEPKTIDGNTKKLLRQSTAGKRAETFLSIVRMGGVLLTMVDDTDESSKEEEHGSIEQ